MVLCVDDGDFVPAQRTAKLPTGVPKPVGARPLSAFVTPNRFAGLSQAARKQRWRGLLEGEGGTATPTNNCNCGTSNCNTTLSEEPGPPTATAANFPQPRPAGTGDTAKLLRGIQAAMEDRDEVQEEKERAQKAWRLSQRKRGARDAGAAGSGLTQVGLDPKARGAREAGATGSGLAEAGLNLVAVHPVARPSCTA